MKKVICLLGILVSLGYTQNISKDMKEVLNIFHKYGITKCDDVIMKYDDLDKPNWTYYKILQAILLPLL
ncbi:Uncharacterised protein [Campylobacter hyointestinalis]|uniref:Uncharacterized protein n=1 Tax=Campylobacter hyointestinalis subsp. hyointestinalis TaxID=91352 RepID=A0A0S4R5E6_CAMHY|nr:hypothetical protein [Campylobacter hyointestinalis]PPB53488.1 hypothetical protein CDQ68_02160 [Campylobacter hyointestinalis subsp. hyointestinalis]PPB54492.1 hypothetical protein CDQ69_03515 [Campylobacter hyointestinalis subsp. hyointestinalis]PPB55029.1 hypothetical protein CDQ67_06140 [Campylobacter hyointestinalis subsp. hyointestinalis]PPB70925.1 hypothetical protein CDQ77_02180 [Campylobacter hyointestinalis subsp. hyointestinalis]CUU69371.1 Uncharacterised protein [Campylobacter h